MTEATTIRCNVMHVGNGTLGTLDRIIAHLSGFVEMRFKHTGRIYPMFHIETTSESFVVDSLLEDKDTVAFLLTEFCAKQNAQRVVFIDEAWLLDKAGIGSITPEQLHELKMRGISKHPDRHEAVMFQGQDVNTFTIMKRDIIRPSKGKAKLGPLESFDLPGAVTESRWSGLLAHLKTGLTQ